MKAIANGVKNPKSSLSAGCRLFAWSEFQYYPGKNFARISQAHLIDPFYNLSTDLNVIAYTSYISDLINQFYDDFQIDKKALKLLVYIFYYLNKDLDKVLLLTLTFQLKLLLINGILPDFKSINFLNKERPIYFNLEEANFSNQKVLGKYSYRLSKEEINTLIKLAQLSVNKINRLDINSFNQKDLKHLITIFNSYIQLQLNKTLKSFKIVKELDNSID